MNNLENPLQLVKLLKGAALSILLIMLHEKKPVGEEYLVRWSGYSDKTINRALEVLSDPTIDLVMRVSRYAWQLTGYAQQLPLMQLLDDGTRKFSESLKNLRADRQPDGKIGLDDAGVHPCARGECQKEGHPHGAADPQDEVERPGAGGGGRLPQVYFRPAGEIYIALKEKIVLSAQLTIENW
jgi:hypothetical protein